MNDDLRRLVEQFDLTIAIPSYNSAEWLPSTLASVEGALSDCRLRIELVVIDDGSTDDTVAVVSEIAENYPAPIVLHTQVNSGVFEARRRAASFSRANHILFLDSRVLMANDALRHLQQLGKDGLGGPTRVGHVATDNEAALVGRYWEVPTHVFWGGYLRDPKPTVITNENFDSVPKGTGFLLVKRDEFLKSCENINAGQSRFISDDTKLLRDMVERDAAVLDPAFKAVYRPRTNFQKFLAHGFLRGTLFVDSYYGTSRLRAAILWGLVISLPAALIIFLGALFSGNFWLALVPAVLALTFIAGLIGIAIRNSAPARAVLSFIVFTAPFAVVFWAGVVRGLFLRVRNGSS